MTGASAPRASAPPAMLIILAFAAIYVLWGSTYLAIRYAVETLPPLLMIGTRSVIAALLIGALRGRAPVGACGRRQWRAASVSGALLFLGCHGLLSWAEQYTDSGVAALVLATIPAWLALFSHYADGTALHTGTVAGLMLGFVGVAVLCGPAGFAEGTRWSAGATGLLLVSAACWAGGSVYARHAPLPRDIAAATAMQLLCGGVLALITGVAIGEGARVELAQVSCRSALCLLYLIVFGSVVSFSAYTWLLRVADPVAVGSYAFVNPIVAVFLGWLIAGEKVNARTAVAGIAIIAAVFLLHRQHRCPSTVRGATS